MSPKKIQMQFNSVISVLFYCAANCRVCGSRISSSSPLENCSQKINCPLSMASHIVFISIFYVRCRCEPSFRVLYSCFICGIYIWTWHSLLLFIYFILRILNTALKSKQFLFCACSLLFRLTFNSTHKIIEGPHAFYIYEKLDMKPYK